MLNADSLGSTVSKCRQYPGYRAAIIFKDCESRETFAHGWMIQTFSWQRGARMRGSAAIEFDNGSIIMLYTPRWLPSQSVNECIVDGDADVPVEKLPALAPYIDCFRHLCCDAVVEQYTDDESELAVSSKALDDFLAEFKILKTSSK